MNVSLFQRIASEVIAGVGVSRTGRLGLAKKVFSDGSKRYIALEQNKTRKSEYAKLAQEGHQVVQFKDQDTDKYVGVCVDGLFQEY